MSIQMSSDLEFEATFTQALAEQIGSVRALTVFLLVKYQEWQQLVDLTIDHSSYEDPRHFALDYQITKVLSKSSNLPLDIDLEAKARAAFYAAEVHNRETNDRLDMTDWVDHPVWFSKFVSRVETIMGPLDVEALERIQELSRHGPGAVVGVKGGSVASQKYDRSPTISEEFAPFAESFMPAAWYDYAISGKGVLPVSAGVFFTAPKDAKNRRGCAYGANVNQYGTLGVGQYLSERLRIFGVDLGDQGWNQWLASQAHLLGCATIDLSQASDLLAKFLVRIATSSRWYHLLNLLRDHRVKIDGKIVTTEKFCAMGNGFTFALETIVFLACVQAIVPREEWHLCTAYGDDIICPQAYAHDVTAALTYLGFKVNISKSFLAGRFFESCGTDWFDGQNVRPFFLRRESSSLIPYPVIAANQLRLWSRRLLDDTGCDKQFQSLWEQVHRLPSREWRRVHVPAHFGDTGFITSPSEVDHRSIRLPHKVINGVLTPTEWEGFDVKAIQFVPQTLDPRTPGSLFAGLARLSLSSHMSETEKLAEYTYQLAQNGFAAGGILPPKLLGLMPTRGEEPIRGLYRIRPARYVWSREWPKGFEWT
jgi:hypothetical protein